MGAAPYESVEAMQANGYLESDIGRKLIERKATLATAESCSGGLIAHRITNVTGASAYFLGGVVSYSNQAKLDLLGVNATDLNTYGAVSEPVARQMAEGVRGRFGATWGIGVTGIAGPTGGTADKPVGLVYVAVAGPAGTAIRRNLFVGPRESVKEQTAQAALELLAEQLQ
jgi:PncC family amidohydrolase